MDAQPPSRAFDRVVLPHLDAAYNLARWLTRNGHDAEDVVQEAFLRALRFFGGFHGGNARAWLLAIVRNTCYDWLRRIVPEVCPFDEEVHSSAVDPDPTPEDLLIEQAGRHRLRALETLPLAWRRSSSSASSKGCHAARSRTSRHQDGHGHVDGARARLQQLAIDFKGVSGVICSECRTVLHAPGRRLDFVRRWRSRTICERAARVRRLIRRSWRCARRSSRRLYFRAPAHLEQVRMGANLQNGRRGCRAADACLDRRQPCRCGSRRSRDLRFADALARRGRSESRRTSSRRTSGR